MASEAATAPRGLLLDLNGVFYVGDRLIEGASKTLAFLRDHEVPHRFVTNTTTHTREELANALQERGLSLRADEIISAPYAAVLQLRRMGSPVCRLLMDENLKREFAEFETDDANPEAIVVGDIGARWNYELINELFEQLCRGATLIALHKGRYWETERGLRVDVGAFVAALEYASGSEAIVVGKPAPAFFELALGELGMDAAEAAMIGDDIEADVGGAQAYGMKGILVQTGKFRPELVARSDVLPDLQMPSIADLPALF